MVSYPDEPMYSEKYCDEYYEYRHVILTKSMAHDARTLMNLRASRLLREDEWRSIGVQQSRGWQHFMQHPPEPHVLLFRRPLGTDPVTGQPAPGWEPPSNESKNTC